MRIPAVSRIGTLSRFAAIIAWPVAGRACAVCFGKSDAALAQGMNMGILTLLVVLVGVLAAFASFFVFLARRSAALVRAERGIGAR